MILAGSPGVEVRILAPAKINLGLAVLGRRLDGYHELRTIFQAISLCDRLRLRHRRRGIRVACAALPGLGERNLAHQAAEIFLRETGRAGGVEIELTKRIPLGGGLGGGSSDAAAVLLGCCRLFGLRPALGRLQEWAATLGSDVPFFLRGGAALGKGRGEIITPLPPWPQPVSVLICAPARGIATAEVYDRLRAVGLTSREETFNILPARWREGNLHRLGEALFNDLEGAAFSLSPALAPLKSLLLGAGAEGASMSGSGSCCFGLFAQDQVAEAARRALQNKVAGRLYRVRFMPARRRWGVVKR